MKILTAAQIRHLDAYTCKQEGITSEILMNRAAQVFTDAFVEIIDYKQPVVVLCGTGNNGGDGFVVFRHLKQMRFDAACYLVPFGEFTEDCQAQFDRVKNDVILWDSGQTPVLSEDTVLIDALLGIGSNRPPSGILESAIQWANNSGSVIYSIDMPSGLSADELPEHQTIINASKTFTFHCPKLTFFLPETAHYAGEWSLLDIGLDREENSRLLTRYQQLQLEDVRVDLPKRLRFSHKGTYGHALLIAGSKEKQGACLLAAEATLRAGAGLLTVSTEKTGATALNIRLPEAMLLCRENNNERIFRDNYSAIGIGPGMGIGQEHRILLIELLQSKKTCVIDADALTILANEPVLLELLHEGCILTPHPKEFERLVGFCVNSQDRLERAIHFAQMYGCQLVLKDAVTAIVNPKGKVSFNSTGNPGMAKGGSGDVLMGVLLGLVTQGIDSERACRIGVYFHGLAGDKAKELLGERSMLPSDLIRQLRIE